MFIQSGEIKDLAGALAKAQAEFINVPKGHTAKIRMKSGGEYSYTYADLADILEMVRKPLSKNELAVSQFSDTQEAVVEKDGKSTTVQSIVITTMLMHSSGQFLKNEFRLPVVDTGNNAIQAMGSSITYGRRYELSAMLGISSEEDTDVSRFAKKSGAGEKAPISAPGAASQRSPLQAVATLGEKKFKSDLEFSGWRTDNNLAPVLSKASGPELKVIHDKLLTMPDLVK